MWHLVQRILATTLRFRGGCTQHSTGQNISRFVIMFFINFLWKHSILLNLSGILIMCKIFVHYAHKGTRYCMSKKSCPFIQNGHGFLNILYSKMCFFSLWFSPSELSSSFTKPKYSRKESRKKVVFLVFRPLRWGGLYLPGNKEKLLFLKLEKKCINNLF